MPDREIIITIKSFITGAFRKNMRVVWNQVSESYRTAGEIYAYARTKISEHATLRERRPAQRFSLTPTLHNSQSKNASNSRTRSHSNAEQFIVA